MNSGSEGAPRGGGDKEHCTRRRVPTPSNEENQSACLSTTIAFYRCLLPTFWEGLLGTSLPGPLSLNLEGGTHTLQ